MQKIAAIDSQATSQKTLKIFMDAMKDLTGSVMGKEEIFPRQRQMIIAKWQEKEQAGNKDAAHVAGYLQRLECSFDTFGLGQLVGSFVGQKMSPEQQNKFWQAWTEEETALEQDKCKPSPLLTAHAAYCRVLHPASG